VDIHIVITYEGCGRSFKIDNSACNISVMRWVQSIRELCDFMFQIGQGKVQK
jgi:hypothetical protein